MCFYVDVHLEVARIKKEFGLDDVGLEDFDRLMGQEHIISGFSNPELMVVGPGPSLAKKQWGLVPAWTQSVEKAHTMQQRGFTLNARAETIFDKPSFRGVITRKRCILPIAGFYEWQHLNSRDKVPYYITGAAAPILATGCIWDEWSDPGTGEVIDSFSMVTTQANPMMAAIHNTKQRMPLFLEPHNYSLWLDPTLSPEEVKKILVPFDTSNMQAWKINKFNPRQLNTCNQASIKAKSNTKDLFD